MVEGKRVSDVMDARLGIHRITLPLLVVLAAVVPALGGQPRLVCANRVHDFGSVTNRDKISHTFVLKNVGDAALVIDVRGCCGASAHLGSQTILPGSNTALEVNLSLKGRNGKVRKGIPILSNDPTNEVYCVYLTGQAIGPEDGAREETTSTNEMAVVGDLVIVPGQIRMSSNAVSGMTRHVAVRSRTGTGFRVLKTTLPNPNIQVRLRMLSAHNWRITLNSLPAGSELDGENLVITTDRQDKGQRLVVPFCTAVENGGRSFSVEPREGNPESRK